jgi:cell division protein FtsL
MRTLFLSLFLILSLSLLYLYQHAKTVELTIRLNQRKIEIERREEIVNHLQAVVSSLTREERIAKMAANLGLRYPKEKEVKIIKIDQ